MKVDDDKHRNKRVKKEETHLGHPLLYLFPDHFFWAGPIVSQVDLHMAVLLAVGKIREELDGNVRLRVENHDDGNGGGALAKQGREIRRHISGVPGHKSIYKYTHISTHRHQSPNSQF